jgi:hypothetical protein
MESDAGGAEEAEASAAVGKRAVSAVTSKDNLVWDAKLMLCHIPDESTACDICCAASNPEPFLRGGVVVAEEAERMLRAGLRGPEFCAVTAGPDNVDVWRGPAGGEEPDAAVL